MGAVWRTNDVRWLQALMAIHPRFSGRGIPAFSRKRSFHKTKGGNSQAGMINLLPMTMANITNQVLRDAAFFFYPCMFSFTVLSRKDTPCVSIARVIPTGLKESLALRTECVGVCGKLFQAVGVATPPTIREL